MLIAPLLAIAAAGPAALEAGAARVDITPPLALKASLGGYGERMSRPATGVHDRVWAKALVLRQGGRRFAVVTADILGFPAGFRQHVADRLAAQGWHADDILLLASHSHTSIDMTAINPNNTLGIPQLGVFQRPLFELTRDRIASVVAEAAKAPAPVRVGWAQRTLPGWSRNRRSGNTATDPTLTVVRIDTAAGVPLAALVNWAAHPTFMDSVDMEYSGDWPGHLQREMEAMIGGGATVMFFNGAEGDQSPTPRGGASRWENALQYGLDLGGEAWRTWKSARVRAGVEAAWHVEPIVLPHREWHPDFMQTGGTEYGVSAEGAQALLERLAPERTLTTSLRLGNLLIVGVPGEMASALGLDLRQRAARAAGVRQAVIGGLANEWVSYILTPEEYRKGGYEASVSTYGPTLGPTVTEAAIRGAAALRQGRAPSAEHR